MAEQLLGVPGLFNNFLKGFTICLIMLSMVTSRNGEVLKSLHTFSKDDSQSDVYNVKEVIVIGGGMAGMAAARMLTNHQEFNVKVLEACEDRYGGRVWTNRKNRSGIRGMEAELGAMWLNSKRKDNKLLKLIKDLELIIKEPGPVQLHVPHMKKVYTGENVDQIFSQTASVIKMAVKKARLSKEDISLTEAIQKELGMLEKTADQSIIESLILSHYAMAVHDYSAQLFEPEKDFGWDSVLVDGFDQVIDGLVGGLEGEIPIEVELGTVVRQIEVNKKQKKLIVRTTELKQHFADAVIIALPLGVLKNNSILFDPHLPREWYSALKKMGISYTNKLILEFDRVFWPKDVGVFTMATNNSSEFGYFQTWINVHFFTEKPILMGNVYGDKAKAFEQLTDEDVKLQAMLILSKLFGKKMIEKSQITRIVRSKWQSEPSILGGNSYPIYGIRKENLDHLSAPVCPHIYFAGEYTDIDNAHTLLGAFNSGYRAAKQLIEGYCQKQTKKKTTDENNGESVPVDSNHNVGNSKIDNKAVKEEL